MSRSYQSLVKNSEADPIRRYELWLTLPGSHSRRAACPNLSLNLTQARRVTRHDQTFLHLCLTPRPGSHIGLLPPRKSRGKRVKEGRPSRRPRPPPARPLRTRRPPSSPARAPPPPSL